MNNSQELSLTMKLATLRYLQRMGSYSLESIVCVKGNLFSLCRTVSILSTAMAIPPLPLVARAPLYMRSCIQSCSILVLKSPPLASQAL